MQRFCMVAAAAIIGFSTPVSAVTILDQYQLDGSEQDQAIHSTRPVGQSFTAGVTGTLASLELSLYENGSGGDITLDILDLSGGDFWAAPSLGMVSKTEGELGSSPAMLDADFITGTFFDLSFLNISVMSGDALGFRLSTDRVLNEGTNVYAIRTSVFTDQYAGGAYFRAGLPSPATGDAAFKLSVTAVPLPAAGMLLLTGLGGLAFAGRRKKG